MNDTRHTMMNAPRTVDAHALQARYALRVAARLSSSAEHTEHHVDERLRVARERALDRARARRAALPAPAVAIVGAGSGAATLALGSSGDDGGLTGWWKRLGMLLPLLVLVAGLVVIQYQHARLRAAAVASVDVDLLVDDLPPQAYSDPGFVEFLKTSHEP